MQQIALNFGPQRQIYTVEELNGAIRDLLAVEFTDIWVAGEISGVKLAGSGHFYFTLKERDATIRCVCFRMTARFLRFKPQDGVAVLCRGRVDVYAARGEYQLIVDTIEPRGFGALQLAFENLKRKLAAEGLFEQGRKRPLPDHPRRIGIVTSPKGAAIHDLLQILERRFPGLHIRLFPARVQGEGSVEDICAGLDYFRETGWADVVIVGRGGGSLEDLWSFNEEAVARAIVASPAPVIAAVGHETDFTIADFVADLRAPTPSAAAELVVRTREQILERADALETRLVHQVRYRIAVAQRRLHQQGIDRAVASLRLRVGRLAQRTDEADFRLRDSARDRLRVASRRLEAQTARLRHLDLQVRFERARHRIANAEAGLLQAFRTRLSTDRTQLAPLAARLSELSPLRILDRGYALVRTEDGRLIKSPADAPAGTGLRIRVAAGEFAARSEG